VLSAAADPHSKSVTVERAESLDTEEIADVIQEVGFECTDCGDCCTADGDEALAVTVFPDERREIADAADADASPEDVSEPSPFSDGDDETFEWTVRRDACGDCFFHQGDACSVYEARPSVCRTYPFAVRFEEDAAGERVVELDSGKATLVVGECEGTGRDTKREDALELAQAVKRRALKEEREARQLLDVYEDVEPPEDGVVVHDSEGAHIVEK
jgi:Fe-S-cluster containining protein